MDHDAASSSNSSSLSKRFICPLPACRKRFTRAEHLQRHSLNHKSDASNENICPRCAAHFKRKDLLERHLNRHRQKDAEAGGGEGSGVLKTRKRQWTDATNANLRATRSRDLRAASIENSEQAQTSPALPPSPPTSAQVSENSHDNANAGDISNNDCFGITYDEDMVFPGFELHDDKFVGENFWPQTVVNPPSVDVSSVPFVPYDDIFNADTASSFNMPFTTKSNYNWLFDLDLSKLDKQLDSCPLQTPLEQFEDTRFPFPPARHDLGPYVHQSLPLAYQNSSDDVLQSFLPIPSPDTSNINANASSRFSQSATVDSAPRSTSNSHSHVTINPTSAHHVSDFNTDAPIGISRSSSAFPTVDEFSRQQLLRLIELSPPIDPNGFKVTRNHPLLSLASLQTFSDLFFSHFNVTYPLLHRARFDPSKVDSLLLVAVLLLGASYSSDKEAHQLAVCIHDMQRPMIFSHASFSAKPELWVLQTILLVECFGKSRAGRKQHDMSHLFHGLLINLIRRSDCQSITYKIDHTTGDLEDDWKAWSDAEQRKRLAFLCFMWDTQHAVLFCQSLCMSAFELRSTVPCNQSLWEADCALSWHEQRRLHKESPLFLTLLKSFMTPGAPLLPKHINGLSRVLLLHGLMSISWDMKRRDQTSLDLASSGSPLGDWKWQRRMGASYDAWKADFGSFCMNMMQATANDPARRDEVLRFKAAYNAIYHAAHVILDSEFLDLQIYAGARHILGRPVARADYVRAKRVVHQWLKNDAPAAGRAAWHAAHILGESIMNLEDFQLIGVFHYPWCLYLANITCWAFHHAQPTSKELPDNCDHAAAMEEDDDDIIWDAKAEMNALISSMTTSRPEDLAGLAGKRRVDGLTAVISQALAKVRWAVVHDANSVLRGLVPWRLINQFEAPGRIGEM